MAPHFESNFVTREHMAEILFVQLAGVAIQVKHGLKHLLEDVAKIEGRRRFEDEFRLRQLKAGFAAISRYFSPVEPVTSQIGKAVEPEKMTMGVVRIIVRIRKMGNHDLQDAAGLHDAFEQTHQLWKVADVLEEVIRVDRFDRCRRHPCQDLIHIPHNVDALMIQRIDANRVWMPLSTAATKLQRCVLEVGQAVSLVYDRHLSLLVQRQAYSAAYPCSVSESFAIDIEAAALATRAAISTLSVNKASVTALGKV